MTVSATTPSYQMYPSGLSADMPGHQLTYTGVAPGGKRLPAPSFHALVEIFNPLEHLPIVSTIYQALTGDRPTTTEQILGDTLYGGPLGFAGAVAKTMVEGAVKVVEGKTSSAPTALASSAGPNAASPNGAGGLEIGGQAAPLGLASANITKSSLGNPFQSATATEPAPNAPSPSDTGGLEIGGQAAPLGLASANITKSSLGNPFQSATATEPAPKAPTPKLLAQLTQPDANQVVAAEAGGAPAAAKPVPASVAPADPGAISGPITGTEAAAVSPYAKDAPVPVPLPPPNAPSSVASAAASAAPAAAPTPQPQAIADASHKPAFMPLPARGPRFFPLNNAPAAKAFYRAPAPAPSAPPASASSAANTAETLPSAARTAVKPAPAQAPTSPSALAAALAPALDQPTMPLTSPADSLANPLMPSLSPAALSTTEAATEKYNRALDLAQKLKFFYGGSASRGGLTP